MGIFITCTLHQMLLGWSNQWKSGGSCSTLGRSKKCLYQILVGKPKGETPLGRLRRKW